MLLRIRDYRVVRFEAVSQLVFPPMRLIDLINAMLEQITEFVLQEHQFVARGIDLTHATASLGDFE
jgi:hypothetical protein